MNLRGRQYGITAISMVVIIGLVAFFALLALRLFPAYMGYFKVASAMESISAEESGLSDAEIFKTLKRRLQIDDVDYITEDEVEIEDLGDERALRVQYEVRTSILGNVDVVMSFDKEVSLSKRKDGSR